MEKQFIAAWTRARQNAAAIGVRMRPVADEEALQTAHRYLSGHRESDGFAELAAKGYAQWSLEALAVDKRFTALFTDEEVNNALERLLAVNYRF